MLVVAGRLFRGEAKECRSKPGPLWLAVLRRGIEERLWLAATIVLQDKGEERPRCRFAEASTLRADAL